MKLSQKYVNKNLFKGPVVVKTLKNQNNYFASLSNNQHFKSSDKEMKSNFATVKYVVAGSGVSNTNKFREDKNYICEIEGVKNIECRLKSFEQKSDFYNFEAVNFLTKKAAIKEKALNQYFFLEILNVKKQLLNLIAKK